MSAPRFGSLVVCLMLLSLCLAPTTVQAKGKPGGGGKPGGDENCANRHIWANTPNLYETEAGSSRLVVPAGGAEVTVARFQVDVSDSLRGPVTADGFKFALLQGTPGGITFRVYVLSCGTNCFSEEVNRPEDFALYGSATPASTLFTVNNTGTAIVHDLLGSHLCVYVTAENAGATVGEVFQLGVDYSYTKGTNKKALNADCEKYQTHGLSNDKSFFRNGAEGPAPALSFVEFSVQ